MYISLASTIEHTYIPINLCQQIHILLYFSILYYRSGRLLHGQLFQGRNLGIHIYIHIFISKVFPYKQLFQYMHFCLFTQVCTVMKRVGRAGTITRRGTLQQFFAVFFLQQFTTSVPGHRFSLYNPMCTFVFLRGIVYLTNFKTNGIGLT